MRLVLASNNAKKLAELKQLFDGLAVDLVAQASLGISEAEEPHGTFVENALAKARHAARLSGVAAIADDSGLCTVALGGAPGVVSAHYAGELTSTDPDREARRRRQDAANNALLLERLAGQSDRRAWFVSTIVALRHADDPEPLIATGRWHGQVLPAPRGTGGFGYDPLMYLPDEGCTVAELASARKNLLSHRALAAAAMRELMRREWRLAATGGDARPR